METSGQTGKMVPPDPDLVEAACLAHDLGHPPFGHVGEETLHLAIDRAIEERHSELTPNDRAAIGGFEGNAQTFRVLTYLSARVPLTPRCGLDLTRATLDAATKYPWLQTHHDPHKLKKWGAYGHDADRFAWVRKNDHAGAGARLAFEAQLMDWCDDVTYAVHDVLDFYRGGQIHLDRLLALRPRVGGAPELSDEALDFLEVQLAGKVKERADWNLDDMKAAWVALAQLSDIDQPWEPSLRVRAAVQSATSRIITFFTDGVGWDGDAPCLHRANLVKDASAERAKLKTVAVALLKELLRLHVITQPALGTQQKGQTTIVAQLFRIYSGDSTLLPADRHDDLDDHGDPLRAAADHVASLTESDAQVLYRRLTGIQLGALTDVV
jgi:dGTPase